jgi:hypothetical protein
MWQAGPKPRPNFYTEVFMKHYGMREGRLRKLAQDRIRREEARKEAEAAAMRWFDGGLVGFLFGEPQRDQGAAR